VRLVGYSLGDGPFKAGERMPLNLFWETLSGGLPSLLVSLQLQDENGQSLVVYETEPVRSTQEWRPGYILRDPHDVPLSPTLPPGRYNLVLSLVTPEQARLKVKGQEQLLLTDITTVDRPRTFESPAFQFDLDVNFNDQARLVGLDLPQQSVKAGQGLPLMLYWQALSTFDRSWTVFVHLIDQKGQIVSQQDQVPGAGQFPTTGWLPDEYLTDSYHLQVPADTPAGEDAYLLEVGLYDANDFTRLPILEGGETAGDHVVLKQWPISVE
jgi:hypothetical protein